MVDAILLGSSINTLVCAAYLAKSGAKVMVLEPHGSIGGAARLEEVVPGFRAAVAPAEAGWLSPKISADLDLENHGSARPGSSSSAASRLIALSGNASGEGHLSISADVAATRASIARHSTRDAEKWEAFAGQMDRLAGFLGTLYEGEAVELMNPAAGELMTLAGHGLRLRTMGKGDMVEMLRVLPMSLRDLLEDWFESDLLRGALAWTGLANLFQGPLSAGTGFTLLHHLIGRPRGAFGARTFPTRETEHLPTVLGGVLKKLGVEIRTRAPATVLVEGGRAVGVTLEGGETIRSRVVVSGSDPKRAFLKELAPWHLPPEFVSAVSHVKLRGVRAVAMFAVDRAPAFSGLSVEDTRNVLVHAPGIEMLERAYDAAKHGGISGSLAFEVTIPSLHDPSLAPAGKHVVHVAMQYAPYRLKGGAWDEATRSTLAQRVLGTLESLAPGFGASVVGSRLSTPLDMERDYTLTEGQLYGGELTLDQILFMRPVGGFAHYATPIVNHFLCGDATHPGGAIVGMSGHHAAARIRKSL